MTRGANGVELRLIGKQVAALDARLATLVETAAPQRQAMLEKLDTLHGGFTAFRAEMKSIPPRILDLEIKVEKHENLKNRVVGWAAAASLAASAFGALIMHRLKE